MANETERQRDSIKKDVEGLRQMGVPKREAERMGREAFDKVRRSEDRGGKR